MTVSRHPQRGAVFGLTAAVALSASFATAPAFASDFYKDKTITISIGSGVGGGFDTYARTVAQFLGRHIPGNPSIKPVNRPGAGGRANANLLYLSDPKDGTAIGLLGPWLVTEPLLGAARRAVRRHQVQLADEHGARTSRPACSGRTPASRRSTTSSGRAR